MDNEELEKRLKWFEKKYGPYIETKGISNYKNLFRKPTRYEWVILLMMTLAVFMSIAYKIDIQNCVNFYEENIIEIYKIKIGLDNETNSGIFEEDLMKSVELEKS